MSVTAYSDWYLPSKDELNDIYINLYLAGKGGLTNGNYWSSSEDNAVLAWAQYFLNGVQTATVKSYNVGYTRAVRHFTSSIVYSLGSFGQAGYIFHITSLGGGSYKYYECTSTDIYGLAWSNLFVAIGTTGTAIGDGAANTAAIIAQIGHTDSAAKHCDDLEVTITTADLEACFPIYRFYISELSSITTEVFPLSFLSTSLIDELEENQVFYRRKFSGNLIFGTRSKLTDVDGIARNRIDDWTFFWGYEQTDPCVKLYLTITKTVSGVTTIYWEGFFSTTDGSFDIDKCMFEINPKVNDDYADIFDNADTQLNILSVSPVVTTRAVLGVIDVTFTRNRWLMDVIELLANEISPGSTLSSTFFTDATNPATLSANDLTLLTIAQKSDIIRPASSNPATTALMSWNELVQILWGMFQVMWDYDPLTDTINVEHISWFTSIDGMDLRTQVITRGTNKYSYLKPEMPKYEKFAFMEADNINFVGDWIMYQSNCVNPDPKTNVKETIINVTTDLEYIINNPDAIADEGFVILCNYEDGGDYFVKLNSSAYHNDDVRLNMDLSWGNLQDRFYRHNRVVIEGFMNGLVTTFWTAQKTKQQECHIILCDEYHPEDNITTELGETYLGGVKAKVKRAELKPTGEIKFNLVYGPADNAQTPIVATKWILIYEDGCGVFHAILSEAADDDLDIVIRLVIFDSTGAMVCNNGAGVTWTIPDTSLTDDYTIPASACGPEDIPVGGCIWYLPHSFEVVGRPDWPISLHKDMACDCPGMSS